MVTITVQPDDKRLKAIRLTEKSQELSVKKKEKIVDIQQRQIIGMFFCDTKENWMTIFWKKEKYF